MKSTNLSSTKGTLKNKNNKFTYLLLTSSAAFFLHVACYLAVDRDSSAVRHSVENMSSAAAMSAAQVESVVLEFYR